MNRFAKIHSGKPPGGFTLAEVVLALGIVLFCILPIVGLLPVGMNSIRDARNEIAAASVAGWISKGILNASITGTASSIAYTALSPYKDLTWTIGSTSISTKDYPNLSYGGIPASDVLNQHLAAHIQITPPSSLVSTGTALVSVAWPTQAKWDTANQRWTNAQGSVSTWVVFLPRQ